MQKFLSILVFLVAAAGCAGAQEVAMLFYVNGKVEVSAAGTGWKSARPLQRLKVREQVRCGAGGKAGIVLLSSGARYQVSGETPATVQENSVDGAKSLGQPAGLSARAAQKLAGARTGAFLSRPVIAPKDLVYHFDGWMPAGTRKFSWSDENAFPTLIKDASYSFALLDRAGNVAWSTRTEKREATVPANIPDFSTQAPFLWRLTGYSATNDVSHSAWGIVTFLKPQEADEMQTGLKPLKAELALVTNRQPTTAEEKAAQASDTQAYLALIADMYRKYGVLMGAFDALLDDEAMTNALFEEAGDVALAFKGRDDSAKGIK